MRLGEYLLAYDQAQDGLVQFSNDKSLQYYAVLALARIGATDQALRRYKEYSLGEEDKVDSAALAARLVKDMALVAPKQDKPMLFLEAAQLYEKIYLHTNASDFYPAINASTTYYLAGEKDKSKRLAKETLALCDKSPENYWRYASEAEAYLLLGDSENATIALGNANKVCNNDLAAVAATKKQLSLISSDLAVLNTLRLPGIIHFAGHIISPTDDEGRFPANVESRIADEIAQSLEQLNVGIGYGSLASGADILFAEAILARGGEIHITLPFELEQFKTVSVACSGSNWVERFDHCWEQATSHSFTSEELYHGDDTLFSYCSLYAMGRACLRQQQLNAPLSQIVVWDEETTNATAGTYRDRETWIKLGHDCHVISLASASKKERSKTLEVEDKAPKKSNKSLHSILFGDIKGFAKIPDAKLPLFVSHVMGCLADVLEELQVKGTPNPVLMANTWGDGVFMVFEDVEIAAKCSIAMQYALKHLDFEKFDFGGNIELRLGLHFGPIYNVIDPVTKRNNFLGEHVTRAARIEPITPPGEVYVTESFAAQLALIDSHQYEAEYVGYMPMAKNYGDLRMYLLKESTV
ncbi:MAG: class 3 adenylate cyclase [Arenicella sp.]|jgi:class 3 adenylate cyclase